MKNSYVSQMVGNRTHVFLTSRKPGKSSSKSKMLFLKAGPVFAVKTAQQKAISEAGKACGTAIRGKYQGPQNVAARRNAMGACIKRAFGKVASVA